ncbi:MAG TPA: hypothetical protein DIC22_00785 [Chitinophagaceae bacterium]|nr:hypothetical protein [Chitinophagaceae bacterium]
MQTANFIKGGLLALAVTFLFIAGWEFYLRHRGILVAYDDNEALWADKRAMVYEPGDEATVFIGSSRIKYDLDIPTWQAMTGNHAIQLANVGSSPRPVLEDLARDKNFKGRLVIDVTEGLFFSEFNFYDARTRKKIAYYKDLSPTQRFSFQVDQVLESAFVFLDQDNFSMNAMLDNAHPLPYRPDVFPGLFFPREFEQVRFNRQSYMTPGFVADTSQQNQVKAIWTMFGRMDTTPPVSGSALDSILYSVKYLTDKIKERGGQVLFVRTPSSGPVWQGESKGFPRTAYWDRLLKITGCPGIHFQDYPALTHFECPEWSHLSPADAVIYTKNLVEILQQDKGWSFNKRSNAL